MRGRTELHLNSEEYTLIYLNGQLVAECAVGQAKSRDSLEEEVFRARASRSLVRFVKQLPDAIRKIGDIADHINAKPAAKQQAFARGLLDGLDRKTVPYPTGDPVPPIRPDHTRSYEAGYDMGEVIARAAEIASDPKEVTS